MRKGRFIAGKIDQGGRNLNLDPGGFGDALQARADSGALY